MPWRRNLYATEEQLRPDPAYMEKHGAAVQPTLFIDASMRAIAVSWLVEVACEYGLHQETLFLAIALLDRFLTHSKVLGTLRNCPVLWQVSVCLQHLRGVQARA